MKEYRCIRTVDYLFEAFLNGQQCGFDFYSIKKGEWGIDKIVKVPNSGFIIVTFYRERK